LAIFLSLANWTEFGSNAGRLASAAQKHKTFVPETGFGPRIDCRHAFGDAADMGILDDD
jgi:hypothetical protein